MSLGCIHLTLMDFLSIEKVCMGSHAGIVQGFVKDEHPCLQCQQVQYKDNVSHMINYQVPELLIDWHIGGYAIVYL